VIFCAWWLWDLYERLRAALYRASIAAMLAELDRETTRPTKYERTVPTALELDQARRARRYRAATSR
jgi:hypothetical protein